MVQSEKYFTHIIYLLNLTTSVSNLGFSKPETRFFLLFFNYSKPGF